LPTTKIRILAVFCLLLMIATDLSAARRALRIDFGAWGPERSFQFDNLFCPMHISGSALDNLYYDPNASLIFQNDVFPDTYTARRYCQSIPGYEDGMTTDEYLNSEIFPADEAGLAAKVGTNQDDHVRAFRYTFVDGDPFDEKTTGYQWAFYEFSNGITIVALYGDLPVRADDFSPVIYFESKVSEDIELFWSAGNDGFEGQYFCFNTNFAIPEFLGLWDGEFAGTEPADGCTLDVVPTREALVALYNSTDGDNWINNTNWLIGDPCLDSWYGVGCGRQGVYCDALEGPPPEPGDICYGQALDVMGLHLADNNLSGTIPPEIGKSNFPDLLELDLSRNRLSGSIPAELGNLATLEQLYLSGNQLRGDVPEALCNLTNIIDIPIDGGPLFSLAYNRLQSPDTLLCDFQDAGRTQTVPPLGLVITRNESTVIELAWDAIEYTENPGRYRAWYSTSIDGPYMDGGATTSKSETSLTIEGLQRNTTYYIVVRTETDALPFSPNNLESDDSEVVIRISDEILSDGFEPSTP
jgi:hypothetical protein